MTIQETDRKWVDALTKVAEKLSGSNLVVLYFVDRETEEVDAEKTLTSFMDFYGPRVEEK